MEDSLEAIGEAAELGRVRIAEPPGRQDPGRTIDRLVQRACTTRAAWLQRLTSAPISVGDLGARAATPSPWSGPWRSRCTAGTWPRPTGAGRPLPEDLAVRLYDVALAVVTPDERGPRFAGHPCPASAPRLSTRHRHLARDLRRRRPGSGPSSRHASSAPAAPARHSLERWRGCVGSPTRVEQLLGQAVVATTPVAGGDICTSTRVRLSDGSSALVKTRAGAPADFFETEARGPALAGRARRRRRAPRCSRVEHDCLVLRWIEPARPTAGDARRRWAGRWRGCTPAVPTQFGGRRRTASSRSLPAAEQDRADAGRSSTPTRRVLPYLKLAADRGHVEPADVATIEGLVGRITDLAGPEEPPARLHGDLLVGQRRVVRSSTAP